jgi:hypothetical protein
MKILSTLPLCLAFVAPMAAVADSAAAASMPEWVEAGASRTGLPLEEFLSLELASPEFRFANGLAKRERWQSYKDPACSAPIRYVHGVENGAVAFVQIVKGPWVKITRYNDVTDSALNAASVAEFAALCKSIGAEPMALPKGFICRGDYRDRHFEVHLEKARRNVLEVYHGRAKLTFSVSRFADSLMGRFGTGMEGKDGRPKEFKAGFDVPSEPGTAWLWDLAFRGEPEGAMALEIAYPEGTRLRKAPEGAVLVFPDLARADLGVPGKRHLIARRLAKDEPLGLRRLILRRKADGAAVAAVSFTVSDGK